MSNCLASARIIPHSSIWKMMKTCEVRKKDVVSSTRDCFLEVLVKVESKTLGNLPRQNWCTKQSV